MHLWIAIATASAFTPPDRSKRAMVPLDDAGVSSDLVDFPVLLDLGPTEFDASVVPEADLRIEDQDGQALAFAVERWTPAEAVLWVRATVHAASGGDGQWLWLDWSSPPAGGVDTDVFAGWTHVYHLDDLSDAVAGGQPLLGSGTQPYGGRVGGGVHLGTVDELASPPDGILGVFTFSAWLQSDTTSQPGKAFAGRAALWELMGAPGQRLVLHRQNIGTDLDLSALETGWHLWTVTWDDGAVAVKVYRDGQQVGGDTVPVPDSSFDPLLTLGGGAVTGVDEVRLERRVRDPAWIALEYRSQSGDLARVCFPGTPADRDEDGLCDDLEDCDELPNDELHPPDCGGDTGTGTGTGTGGTDTSSTDGGPGDTGPLVLAPLRVDPGCACDGVAAPGSLAIPAVLVAILRQRRATSPRRRASAS